MFHHLFHRVSQGFVEAQWDQLSVCHVGSGSCFRLKQHPTANGPKHIQLLFVGDFRKSAHIQVTEGANRSPVRQTAHSFIKMGFPSKNNLEMFLN